jgi:hypothetical protein
MYDGRETLAKGDHALAALLRMHGLIMNGGVFHAVEVLDEDAVNGAIAGYEFYGLGAVKDVLTRASDLMRRDANLDEHEILLDSDYTKIIPEDSSLVAAFEKRYATNPKDFAQLQDEDEREIG